MGAQTETELKEKKLRVEDALNATKAAVEEVRRSAAAVSSHCFRMLFGLLLFATDTEMFIN